ncbi:general transcriptional corepressor trfA-like [Drosophila willistoni]|uniref:general transcriptional corepressor trfA-like n=1 Tax=Drosophila willistoni TaxID=7260 RepID=UPI000C26D819|nr:general transcriptional corepressor trfA-like [Drosophila willistoni]XP_046865731.1 general transcriptional corepressor trfA-like [Drosophila willistoni]
MDSKRDPHNFFCEICNREYPRNEEVNHRQKHEVERARREYLRANQLQGYRSQHGQPAIPRHIHLHYVPCAAHLAGQAQQQQPLLVSVQRQPPVFLQQSSQPQQLPSYFQLLMLYRQEQLRHQQLLAAIQQHPLTVAARQQQHLAMMNQLMHHLSGHGQAMGPQQPPVQPSVLVTQQQEVPQFSPVPGMDSASAPQQEQPQSQATLPPPPGQLPNTQQQLHIVVRIIFTFTEAEPGTEHQHQ